jgi:TonB-dependent receptor
LDNIIIEKSFTPDKPGDFTGGSVNLNTKDYPETKSLVFSTSTGTNSVTRAGEEVLAQNRGPKDWLGFDDGFREIPQIIQEHPDDLLGEKGTSFEISETNLEDSLYLVQYYENASKAFNAEMTGKSREIPLNQNHSLSYGNQHSLFGNPLGMIASLSYSKKYSSYNGFFGSFERTSDASVLMSKYAYDNTSGKEEVLWSGLLNLKYGFHPNHKVGWNLIHSRNGESEARYMFGEWQEFIEEGAFARNYVLSYTERRVSANQFSGSHSLFENKVRADWQIAIDRTTQENPDSRFFTDQVSYSEELDSLTGLPADTSYDIVTSRFSKPKRLWREIDVDKNEYQANITIPLSTKSKFKHGFAIQNSTRNVWERRFEYVDHTRYSNYNGDIQAYIEDLGLDTVTTRSVNGVTRYRYRYTNLLKEYSEPLNSYFGVKEIFAAYGMLDIPLIWNFNFVGGARYEETEMRTESAEGVLLGKGISEVDLLPSVNLIYRAGDRMNIRASYSRTLARPSLLEISSSHIEAFNDGDIYSGNPDLQMSKAKNFDLRWEWFVNPGEIIAVSAFYKKIYDPIEEVILHPVHFEIQPQNSEDAELKGFEIEYRRRLGFINNKLRNFRLGGNYTYVNSKIRLTSAELDPVRTFDPDFPATRPLWGQSPYMVNVDLGFDSYPTGTSVSLFYNVFGRRLKYNSQGATPDVYEEPRNLLDFTLSQRMLMGSTFKFSAKNILNEKETLVYDDLNGSIEKRFIRSEHDLGVTYTVGVTYQVW